MKILQVNTFDMTGGAGRIAMNLHNSYRERGHISHLVVGKKLSRDPQILEIDHDPYLSALARICKTAEKSISSVNINISLIRFLKRSLHRFRRPHQTHRIFDVLMGHEDFNYPGTRHLLGIPQSLPDILHCHNLHGGYFDLRVLPTLNRQVPIVLTLHDAWLLSGHCAHSFSCEQWKTGCGRCPDLSIYPRIYRDGASFNYKRKHEILKSCRVYVASPSRWLMDKVEQSQISESIIESRVIPNGVDLECFKPLDKNAARDALGIPREKHIILFSANGILRNIWKDYKTMRTAIARVAEHGPCSDIVFIALGETAHPERIGNAQILFVPFQDSMDTIALYYQAADIYLHAAKADTFPNTVAEALACGTPAIATAVDGIPEMVLSFDNLSDTTIKNTYGIESATGVLVPPEDPETMSWAIEKLLLGREQLKILGVNASIEAKKRFDLSLQVNRYLEWYHKIINSPSKD